VDRLKSLHHLYITQLSGIHNIPLDISIAKHRNKVPKGPFRWAWETKNTQMALAVLSCHTAFTHDKVSKKQFKKLVDGLQSKVAEGVVMGKSKRKLEEAPKVIYTSPSLFDLTGVSIPTGFTTVNLRKPTRAKVVKAYMGSWDWVPRETVEFVQSNPSLRNHAPPRLFEQTGSTRCPVGTLVCLQEESLKARWISNPNRVTQAFLRPLGEVWQKRLDEFPTDCTKKQFDGVIWARNKLRSGVTLAGADLTSATDKLNLNPCLDLVHVALYGQGVTTRADWDAWNEVPFGMEYLIAINHFVGISRGEWLLDGKGMRWDVGWPLGTRPSFPLLGLVNNLVARKAARELGLEWQDSFRVCGDDIIMDAKMLAKYQEKIEKLGGELNLSKTLVSDRAVEFVGEVITPSGFYAKRVKAHGLSDNSFMLVCSLLGDQAVYLLKGRQKKVWNELKYIPGIAVDGPYSQASHGEKLENTYLWYLSRVKSEKKLNESTPYTGAQLSMDLYQALNELGLAGRVLLDRYIPRDNWFWNDQNKTAYVKPSSGDPRLEDGKTQLETAEAILEKDSFQSYPGFKETLLPLPKVAIELISDPNKNWDSLTGATPPPNPSKVVGSSAPPEKSGIVGESPAKLVKPRKRRGR